MNASGDFVVEKPVVSRRDVKALTTEEKDWPPLAAEPQLELSDGSTVELTSLAGYAVPGLPNRRLRRQMDQIQQWVENCDLSAR